jgi:CheY-like chemotaxis protein
MAYGHGPYPENARTSFSFPDAVDAAYRREQFSTWRISPRRGRSRVNFTALVVEDDALQREALADLLKDEGLEVIECTSAEAAELVVASAGSELKALVTDVSLSGEMSGVELAQYAKRKFPHINVIMVSGRSPPYIPQDASFLPKPYRPRELLEAVLL